MFAYIKGKLTHITPEAFTLEVGGIGYKIYVPINLYTKGAFEGEEMILHTSLVVREDSHRLFGFLTRNDRDLFEKLLAISGIGVKTAINIIGHISYEDLKRAIASGNTLMLTKIPGIGKKTAERIIVELSDRIHKWQANSDQKSFSQTDIVYDAISALINLGYNEMHAQKAVQKVLEMEEKETPELPFLITSALKHL